MCPCTEPLSRNKRSRIYCSSLLMILNDWTDMLEGNAQARTPHMDTLASKGIVFTNAHCAAPCCGPSRSAIMSGIRPSTSGNYINKNSLTHNQILNNAVLLPEFFQQHGYYVSGAGKLFHGYHFNFEVKGRGFDEYYPSKTQDLPSFEGLKFSSKLPLGGWSRTADWGLSVQMSLWMTTLMVRQQIG